MDLLFTARKSGPRNKVGAQLHDSLGPASNLQKIFCAHIENYTPPPPIQLNGGRGLLDFFYCKTSQNKVFFIYSLLNNKKFISWKALKNVVSGAMTFFLRLSSIKHICIPLIFLNC